MSGTNSISDIHVTQEDNSRYPDNPTKYNLNTYKSEHELAKHEPIENAFMPSFSNRALVPSIRVALEACIGVAVKRSLLHAGTRKKST